MFSSFLAFTIEFSAWTIQVNGGARQIKYKFA